MVQLIGVLLEVKMGRYVKQATNEIKTFQDIREEFPNTSFPEDGVFDYASFGYAELIEVIPPTPQAGYKLVEGVPVDNTQVWNEVAYTQEELDVRKAEHIAKLWMAAHQYETAEICDCAIGLLAIGVMQSKPKATAIANWTESIWNGTYYPRKALCDGITEPSYDFSNCGSIPYTIPELSAEVWGS